MLIVKHQQPLQQQLRQLQQQQLLQVQLQQLLPQQQVQRQAVQLQHQRKIQMVVLELWLILTFEQTVSLIVMTLRQRLLQLLHVSKLRNISNLVSIAENTHQSVIRSISHFTVINSVIQSLEHVHVWIQIQALRLNQGGNTV